MRINFVSSFPPRKCGIATFTKDLAQSISNVSVQTSWNVTAIEQCKKTFFASTKYPSIKIFQTISDCNNSTYRRAANKINTSTIDVVNIQHEFGLYKGLYGDYILDFLDQVQKPTVTSFHTVLPDPPSMMKSIVKNIHDLSEQVVVSANIGIDILKKTFGLPPAKLQVIPHGVPDVPFISTERPKKHLGLPGKFVIGSYGLINPDKGIEYVLEALPQVIDDNPDKDIVYFVVGMLHPALEKSVREGYHQLLIDRVKELRLKTHVKFVDKYLTNRNMILHFLASDICAITNMKYKQISSGVLSQALGCGKPVVATKFMHAQEVLADGKGLLVDFGDVESISNALSLLAQNDALRKSMAFRTYQYARTITWNEVAKMYLKTFTQVTLPKVRSALIQPRTSYRSVIKDVKRIKKVGHKKTKL